MEDWDLEKLVAEMRRLGVTRYKKGDVEVDLGPQPLANSEPVKLEPHVAQRMAEARRLSEMERRNGILFGAGSMRPVIPRKPSQ